MFARRRRTSKTSDSTSEVSISFVAQQRLLVAFLTLAAIGFFIWSRYATLELIKFEPLDNISTNSIEQTNPKNFGSLLDQRSTSTYCEIANCETVSCFNIPESLDAGNATSEYIETVFKARCKNVTTAKLSLIKCEFPSNSLRKNWLSTNLSIEELTLESCSLDEIEDAAFGQRIFKKTKKLTLLKNNLASLRKAAFDPLTSLEHLIIRENFIKQAEFNLLENAARSLSNLDLDEVIDNPQILGNITGGTALNKLKVLSLQRNAISDITDESFRGARKVVSLYLIDSGIASLSQRSLEPMSSSINQVFLTGNHISSLPKGIFDSMLHRKDFSVALANNPWNCDCSLQWMQDLINITAGAMISPPICSSPPKNAGKSFSIAEFCLPNSTAPPISKSTLRSTEKTTTTTTTTTKKPETTAVTCSISEFVASGSQRKLLSTDLEFSSRVPGFFVVSVTDNSVVLKLPNSEKGLTLFWFDSVTAKRTVSCAKHVTRIYHVQNIDPDTSYTICVLSDNEDVVSPLNCLAVTTLPAYMSRTWLKNVDKAQAIILLTLLPIGFCFIGIFVTFLIVWKYPSLLQGNKRVMLVKKNILDAIVLPKGFNVEEKTRRSGVVAQPSNKLEDGYMTPLPPAPMPPPRFSRISRVSLLSDWHSYVSEVEPTESLLASWGLDRVNSDLENQVADAPPLPLHPLNNIPSLSLMVEAKAEDAEYGTAAV